MNSSKDERGRYVYEVEPNRWVSRQRVHQMRNRTKDRCRKQVWSAIKHGTLIRGNCEICGSANAQSHHISYDDPFNIQWLCYKHHAQARPHTLKGAPVDSDLRQPGRKTGKWISPEKRILIARGVY